MHVQTPLSLVFPPPPTPLRKDFRPKFSQICLCERLFFSFSFSLRVFLSVSQGGLSSNIDTRSVITLYGHDEEVTAVHMSTELDLAVSASKVLVFMNFVPGSIASGDNFFIRIYFLSIYPNTLLASFCSCCCRFLLTWKVVKTLDSAGFYIRSLWMKLFM